MSAPRQTNSNGAVQTADGPAHILVIDDDRRLRDLLKRFLTQSGFRVTTAQDAAQARLRMQGLAFDLLVLDVMMPGETGLSFARDLRITNNVPILMLTAMGDSEHRIEGLESGVDDYLGKPFEPKELLLRINAILKRAAAAPKPVEPEPLAKPVRLGDGAFDPVRGSLVMAGNKVKLTETEATILGLLAARAPMPMPRNELAAHLGIDNERSVDVQITRLRRKIEEDTRDPVYLKTVRGLGYALIPDAQEVGDDAIEDGDG